MTTSMNRRFCVQNRRPSSMPRLHGDIVRDDIAGLLRLRQFSDGNAVKKVNFVDYGKRRSASSFFLKSSKYRLRSRLLQKDGVYNISLTNVRNPGRRYCSDMWTTLIEVKWRWALLAFSMAFILSWLLFSVIYYCIIFTHGDLDYTGSDWTPCIMTVKSFAGAFMYSLETQTTIGYGSRHPSDACPEVIYAVCLQSMCGMVIQALMVGVVFAKLVRPKKRAQTVCFSRLAVLSMRDNRLSLMFRVGDIRKSPLSAIEMRVFMIQKHITLEGEVMPFYLHELKCKVGDVDGCPLLTWPATVCHSIDEDSPLYDFSAEELSCAKFEIIVVMDGVIPINGVSTQARTSYLPSEIMWGHRLDGLMTYQRENGEYRIDYSKFHSIHPVWTPTCSARQLDAIMRLGMDPADWYEEARRKAEMIDSPECTLTPAAPAPIRRKVTDIFMHSKSYEEKSDDRQKQDDQLAQPIREEPSESVSLLLDDYVSDDVTRPRKSSI